MRKTETLRIIAGKWRSRKITFAQAKGLRPTTDVARETLFNWIAGDVINANCLDMFAGSGALGFEALSRGANSSTFIDSAPKVILKLKENAKLLGAENAEFFIAAMPKDLTKIAIKNKFNIIFIDPPFYQNLIAPTCQKLNNSDYFTNDTLVYIEAEKELSISKIIPENWQLLRQISFGKTTSYLFQLHRDRIA